MANNTIAVLRQMLASLDDAKKYQSLRDVMSTMNAPDLAGSRPGRRVRGPAGRKAPGAVPSVP